MSPNARGPGHPPVRKFLSHSFQQRLQTSEGFRAGGSVGRIGVGGIFAGAHEAVACAIVDDWVVFLAGGGHGCFRIGNGSGDARVVASIEAVDGSSNGSERRTLAAEVRRRRKRR